MDKEYNHHNITVAPSNDKRFRGTLNSENLINAPILYVVYVLVVLVLMNYECFSATVQFYCLTNLLLAYNLSELYVLYKNTDRLFFINPIFLSVIINTFLFHGGITNLLLIKDGGFKINVHAWALPDEPEWLILTMGYICLSSVSMWTGYKLNIGRKLSRIYLKTIGYGRFLGSKINLPFLIMLAIIGYGLKVWMLNVGLYGRIVDPKFNVAVGGSYLWSQLRYIPVITSLTFSIFTIHYFKNRTNTGLALLLVSFLLEVFFSFITGARGPIVMTFILFLFCYYYVVNKVKISLLLVGGAFVIFAFTLGGRFKTFAGSLSTKGIDPITLIQDFIKYDSKQSKVSNKQLYESIYYGMMHRLNYVSEVAMAMRYKNVEKVKSDDPDFVGELVSVPLYTFLPRSVAGTTSPAWGNWFRLRVLKLNSDSLLYMIAFSPIGYLYLMGGGFAVLVGFFIYGILLKFTLETLDYGIIGFLLFLGLFGSIAMFKTNVPAIMIEFIRMLLFLPIVLFFSIKKHI